MNVIISSDRNQTVASPFDLEFKGERIGREGFHYTTMLKRTNADYEIDLYMTVTPLGVISRLEHALSGFENERKDYHRRLIESQKRLAAYQPRLGEAFALDGLPLSSWRSRVEFVP